MQEFTSFPVKDPALFKKQVLQWASSFQVFQCFDSNKNPYFQDKFEFALAVDAISEIKLYQEERQFDLLQEFQTKSNSIIFGYLSYDLKNQIENLESNNVDELNFPSLYFFQARYFIELKDGKCHINRPSLEAIYIFEQIISQKSPEFAPNHLEWQSRISKEAYMEKIASIQARIKEGDVYEVNLCREIYAKNADLDPIPAFIKINEKAQAPFSALLKLNQNYVLSFSPERFMRLKANKMLSQPIKGTKAKGANQADNENLKLSLLQDEKERAENVMIVDLVRNDFARSAVPGSVKVDELFGIYEFENIIQMISSISAIKKPEIAAIDALKSAFPMGSMTGAPKIKAMEIIEELELSKRAVYSGALGYIEEDGSFDFSVLIRSLMYDADKQFLSLHVGGAITIDSVPEKEWEETELKAKSILQYL
ncbi:MAG: anthranilate synthase component I family protein [Chitinophagales bacterium]|nr:anthranilate synthase component I family protein [Chitinophagales bacterium]